MVVFTEENLVIIRLILMEKFRFLMGLTTKENSKKVYTMDMVNCIIVLTELT
jgi:hypothetical protein